MLFHNHLFERYVYGSNKVNLSICLSVGNFKNHRYYILCKQIQWVHLDTFSLLVHWACGEPTVPSVPGEKYMLIKVQLL